MEEDMTANFSMSSITNFFAMLTRTVGIVVLLVGLWAGLKVVNTAWKLYESPKTIESYSLAVEEGSKINAYSQILFNKLDKGLQQVNNKPGPQLNDKDKLRISYFVAWGIVFMLLLVIGKIAFWALEAGGRLVLHNADVEKVAKAMVKEVIEYRDARKQDII